jgi:hypothetical protein
MLRAIKAVIRLLFLRHLLLSLIGVTIVTVALSERVTDRSSFADSDVRRDVMDRWGAPIEQPSPSVRYVTSGAVFSELRPLALDRQQVNVDATMNYRRRGLVFFSGFDFGLTGAFEAHNPEATDIDLAFVFPLQMKRNAVLLSDLTFTVNGKPASVELGEDSDKLVWTGRAKPGEKLTFEIAYRGRGLDSFVWRLDPATHVNDFKMTFRFKGGQNFDYPPEVLSAGRVETSPEGAALTWSFPSLESGVPVGLLLPSQQSYDQLIAKFSGRGWAFYLLLFVGSLLLFASQRHEMRLVEAGLIAASYAIAFPLLGYLAAVMPFWLASILALGVSGALLTALAWLFLSRRSARLMVGLFALCLVLPAIAVDLEGFTGLIYTLEAVALLGAAVVLTARPSLRAIIERALFEEPATAPLKPAPTPAAPA